MGSCGGHPIQSLPPVLRCLRRGLSEDRQAGSLPSAGTACAHSGLCIGSRLPEGNRSGEKTVSVGTEQAGG